MRRSLLIGVVVLVACGDPSAPARPGIDGRYQGPWHFEFLDSVWVDGGQNCGFSPCTSFWRRYADIDCTASVELHTTGGSVPVTLTGNLLLENCSVQYSPQPSGFVVTTPLSPEGLVTPASQTPLTGWATWESSPPFANARWTTALGLRNTSGSLGELIGCTPEENPSLGQFGATLEHQRGEVVLYGTSATLLAGSYAFHCGDYVLFMRATFDLRRS